MKSWSSRSKAAASAAVTALALAAGAWLAWHHPLWRGPVIGLWALWIAVSLWRPGLWVFALPALLPVLNFSPWTGWLAWDEFDLLVLGTLAAGHLRRTSEGGAVAPLLARSALALGAVALWGLARGLGDAGGVELGWFDDYTQPANSGRVAKSLLYAALLVPLLQREWSIDRAATLRRLHAGLLAGLSVVVLATLWERHVYPGLLEFRQPYRTVALFWEMHVGGAAIDAYLVMVFPFVAWALWLAPTPRAWAAAALLALLAGYSGFTTFSRGVYAAGALPLALLGGMLWARRRHLDWRHLAPRYAAAVGIGTVLALLGAWAFAIGGYVGLLGLLLLVGLAVLGLRRRLPGWGGRRTAGVALAAGLLIEAITVLGPGSFMRSRWLQADAAAQGRLAHWRDAVATLQGPVDWLVGKGLGRLPANYAASGPRHELSGSARWVGVPPDGGFAQLAGPPTQSRLGGQFGLTQRVPFDGATALQVDMTMRVPRRVDLWIEVCDRHLLYDAHCQGAEVHWQATGPHWQAVSVPLAGPPFRARSAMARSDRVLSLTVLNPGGLIEIDRMSLAAPGGAQLLANADFSRGLAHWFPVAQEYFLPWHVDNVYLELLVETGLLGAGVVLTLVGWTLWRLIFGRGRRSPAARFFATSLIALLLVGLTGSVLDVPRVAFLWFLLLFAALQLTCTRVPPSRSHR